MKFFIVEREYFIANNFCKFGEEEKKFKNNKQGKPDFFNLKIFLSCQIIKVKAILSPMAA